MWKSLLGIIPALAVLTAHAGDARPMKFAFGGKAASGVVKVETPDAFDRERGYGFEPGSSVKFEPGGFVTASTPFSFSVLLSEGNYHVAVTLGDPQGSSETTVKAESRRLMLERVTTSGGEQVVRRFTVNVRRPDFGDGRRVSLKDRERDYLHWDDRLTLEFNGARPCVASLEITPAPQVPTIFLLGDSTVADQDKEPWNSWGQMLTRFFGPGAAVANLAESGESLRSSLGARRVAKMESMLRKGDYVLIQFGHNDMKDTRDGALGLYETNLTALVRNIRDKGATPVLITSVERKAGVKQETLGDYPSVVRRVAAAEHTRLIDLQAMSRTLYAALGPDLDKAFVDGSHHSNFGSYQIAKCVVEGIRSQVPDLAGHLAADVASFDPSKPDDPAAFAIPASAKRDPAKPDGD